MQKGKIGLFDSGFGGLSVMRQIVRVMPEYDYMYLGDTKNAPFGQKNHAEIENLTKKAVDYLFKNGCELVVLACNSASSQALGKIQRNWLPVNYPNKKVLGVIVPAVEHALKETKNQHVGVMATNATVASGAYEREIKKLNPDVTVHQQACPELAGLIEDGQIDSAEFESKVRQYCEPLKESHVGTVILGCTHYGLAIQKFKTALGSDIVVIDQGPIVATKLADYLYRHPEIESSLGKNSTREFYSTAAGDHFDQHASDFYGEKVVAHQINL